MRKYKIKREENRGEKWINWNDGVTFRGGEIIVRSNWKKNPHSPRSHFSLCNSEFPQLLPTF